MANTPTNAVLNLAVQALVAESTGIARNNILPGNSNNPAPNVLYATVLLTSTKQEGLDSEVIRVKEDPLKSDSIKYWQPDRNVFSSDLSRRCD